MLSVTEMAILGVGALLLFGPEQLPGIMKKAGRVMRDVQNTSQTFIREMERAADEGESHEWTPPVSPVEHHADPTPAPGAATPAAAEHATHVEGEPGRTGFAPHERT